MKLLVTGASGFIGRNLIDYCSSQNIEVIAVIRDDEIDLSTIPFYSNVKIIHCDGNNYDRLPNLIIEKDIEACIHLAWAGSSGNLRADFNLQLKNIENSMKLINALDRLQIKKFIGAGTLAEIDVLNYHDKNNSRPNAVSHYGVAKLATHFMTKTECAKFNIEHVWCYLGNTYGIGNTTQNFVNFAIDLLMSNKKAEFTSGEQWYDFVYISDIVKALIEVVKYGKAFNSYYLGSSKPRKLKDYILLMRDIINTEKEVFLGAIPYNGLSNDLSVYDTTKLYDDTGYQPEIDFYTGFIKTYDWKKNK